MFMAGRLVTQVKGFGVWKAYCNKVRSFLTMMPPKLCAEVRIIPCLQDNYSYIIIDKATGQAACVDPVTPAKVLAEAKSSGCTLSLALTTHKHWDHAGGNEELHKLTGNQLTFIGSGYEETPGITRPVKDGDTFNIGNLHGTAIHAPCHTKGHILYYIRNPSNESEAPLLFTGDTLFVSGCGRFFEGDATQMVTNMKRICELPNSTHLYVGHEYTVKNLEFALSLEPNHEQVKAKLQWAKERRSLDQPTCPSILAEEITYNPFMRFCDPNLMMVLGTKSPDETMDVCRKRKDQF